MELLTYKDENTEYSYYLDKHGYAVRHGEHKIWYNNGNLCEHSFIYHGKRRGEYKLWGRDGKRLLHCFYINGEEHPYAEMNAQEKLLFQIKYPGFRFIEN